MASGNLKLGVPIQTVDICLSLQALTILPRYLSTAPATLLPQVPLPV